ncbi:hypothetical protein C672_1713 [[Clostridium] bifermentans ATCC 638]|uniref:Bacteriophage HK97-gp10, tail-component family protein n=1 Tax=Paraclostridium bifermentans ATCC 638 = DSM 14991 TaxID=1233171 RepID=T4VGC5_PARBF|nr:HK97 gp10 family phage protein [Paraclostridium bifermentans]EQK42769.1 hypothetical protein C672_1713 [[Clostridium] bifermentans ATCC 638] [Paraclostridium bifermentans ATCC 638 = DSM 14991]RIZ58448.1 hypothetical protein CHH45_11525 [Paraclostridium bifermentans]UAG19567.1 HK97 gp10 family phage protein [Paraclostridium bifermentans]
MKIEGLEDLERTLENSSKNFEPEAKKALSRIGNTLLRKVKLKTPVAEDYGGTLRRSWKMKYEERLVVSVINDSEYAPHVEFGHRTRLGKGGNSKNPKYKYKPKSDGIKFVEGRYMLTRSIEEVEKEIEEDLEIIIDNLWE